MPDEVSNRSGQTLHHTHLQLSDISRTSGTHITPDTTEEANQRKFCSATADREREVTYKSGVRNPLPADVFRAVRV